MKQESFDAARADGFKFNADPSKQYYNRNAAVPTAEINVADKNFKFPSVARVNLALEHTFPFGVKATLEGIYSKTLNNILYENANYQWTGKTLNNGGDNRPVYEKQDKNFTQIMYLKNTSEGYTYNLSAKLEKNFDFGLSTMVAYTYGQAKSLTDGLSGRSRSRYSSRNLWRAGSVRYPWARYDSNTLSVPIPKDHRRTGCRRRLASSRL